MNGEVLECGLCGEAPATMQLLDLKAESRLTGETPTEGYGWVPRCDSCWLAYRRLPDQLAAEYLERQRRVPR